MGPKEAKYYRDLLETIGIKFKSKGTRLKGPQYYGIEDTEMASPLSNKEFSRRNFALTEEGKIIPAGSPALIPTEVYPTPKGAITSIATDELAMRNPWLGLIGGAIMSKGKRFSDNTPDTRMYPKYPDGYSKGYGYQDTPYLYPTKRNPDFEPVIQHNKLPQMSRFQIPMAPPRQKIDLDPQQRITMNALERAEGRTRALLAKDKQVILDNNQNPVVVPQSELMERLDSQLKNPLFGNYPWFQEGTVDLGGGNTMYNFNQVPGFGALRNVPDKKAKNTLAYASVPGEMHDLDLATPSGFKGEHYDDAMQIKYDNVGHAMEGIEKAYRNNPDSYYIIGQTGGGLRVWDVGNTTARTHDPKFLQNRRDAMQEMGNDEFYTNMTMGNNSARIMQLADNLGITYDNATRELLRLRREGIIDDRLAKEWFAGKGAHSDARLDEKMVRLMGYKDPNFDSGPPMGYQEMFRLGNKENISAGKYLSYATHTDLMNRLRTARGLIDPVRDDMGLGVLDSKYLDYTMKAMSPDWKEQLRKNWRLGLLAPAVLPQSEEK